MHALESDRPLIVYLDIKSPYAYLARAPIQAMAGRLGIQVDWRPLVLDIPSFLGSARLGKSGRVKEESRSAEQWSGVKYAYFDCRRYANLRGLTLRGTVKIWDTGPVSVAWLWARLAGDEVLAKFIDGVYEPFWKRQLDIEDPAAIRGKLQAAGADLAGFDAWSRGEGKELNADLQAGAFEAGIFGVPTCVFAGQTWFGREHLPCVEWLISGAKGDMPAPAYDAEGPLPPGKMPRKLTFVTDFADPHSWLALPMMLRLARRSGLAAKWLTLAAAKERSTLDLAKKAGDRGGLHRLKRAANRQKDLARYAGSLPDPLRRDDTRLADLALAFVQEKNPVELLTRIFAKRWQEGRNLSEPGLVHQVLLEMNAAAGFDEFVNGRGPEVLQAGRMAIGRVPGVPAVLLDDEPFVGRQHEPLLRRYLGLA